MSDRAAQLGEMFLDLFHHIYVINLPTRIDRKNEVAQQLARIGLSFDHPKVHLFEAVRPENKGEFETIGARGCFFSHIGVLEQAARDQAETFLILEDDADLSKDFEARLADLKATSDSARWDMWYGWDPVIDEVAAAATDAPRALAEIPPERHFPCSHFIGFRRDTGAQALEYLKLIASRPFGHPDGGAMHVDGAYAWFRKAHAEVVTIAPVLAVTYQRSSRTDIHDLKWFDRLGVLAPLVAGLRRLKRFRP